MGAGENEWWRREVFARRRPLLQLRARLLGRLRGFFEGQGFAEVETPALQACPGMEVHLRPFATLLEEPLGGPARTRYLHSSPEFAMKKLMAAGMEKIFQFAHVFRNGERSATHHPEFTMLEWYRAKADARALVEDATRLLAVCAEVMGEGAVFSWQGKTCDPRARPEVLSVAQAFARYAQSDLFASLSEPQRPDRAVLGRQAQAAGLHVGSQDSWEDIFFRILLEKVEPNLGLGAPTFLCDYPLPLAALARPKAEDPRLADRVELYVCALELANGFGELTDAAEQRARFERDRALKEKLYGESCAADEDFLAALEYGLPECAGMALGFDRLVMLCGGAARIEDVLWAPVAGP